MLFNQNGRRQGNFVLHIVLHIVYLLPQFLFTVFRKLQIKFKVFMSYGLTLAPFRPRTHGNVFLRFCIVYCSQGNREQPAHYLKQYKNAGKRFRVYGV